MPRVNTNKIKVITAFYIAGFLLVYQLQKLNEKDDEKKPNFYEAEINANINENLESGYLFNVSNKTYKSGTYHYAIEAKQNDQRIEFLSDEKHSNYENTIVFHWRQTVPPYRIIKKSKADTLYIIKKGRRIAFPKYLDN